MDPQGLGVEVMRFRLSADLAGGGGGSGLHLRSPENWKIEQSMLVVV